MTGIDYVLEAELTGPLAGSWLDAFTTAVHESIARWAVDQLDLDSGTPRESWSALDDPTTRAVAVASDPLLGSGLAEILVPDGRAGQHRQLEAATARAGMSGRQSKPTLCARIAAMMPRWLTRPEIVALTAGFPIPECWRLIANEIGRRSYQRYAPWRNAGASDEWRLMNHLLLAEYFRQCRHANARQVIFDILDNANGILSVRGSLVNTSRWISPAAVVETPIPISGFYGGLRLQHRDRSALLACAHRESTSTAMLNGVMHRIAGPHTQDVPDAVRSGQVDAATWLRARSFAYLRYERTILTYMGIAAIEQLVRALAAHRGVPNYRPNGSPDGIPSMLLNPLLGLPEPLKDRISMIFDSARGNIRNRVMHGVFLLAGRRLQDNLVAGGVAARSTPLDRDPHTPENIAGLVLECLQYLDNEVARTAVLTPVHFDWGSASRLSAAQFETGKTFAQDLIPNYDGSNLQAVESHRQWLSAYFRVVFPGLGQFFRLGYIGFIQRYSQDILPLVHGLAIIFEATFRLTCHLIKLEVVDKPPIQNANAGTPVCVQYFMLDQNGLCRPGYYDRLTEHAALGVRANARAALESAVTLRNALSHGAMVTLDEPTLDVVGRVFMEAIRILVNAGMHHMTQEAAWYRWQDLRQFQHGHFDTDWLAAERMLRNWIITKGRPPKA